MIDFNCIAFNVLNEASAAPTVGNDQDKIAEWFTQIFNKDLQNKKIDDLQKHISTHFSVEGFPAAKWVKVTRDSVSRKNSLNLESTESDWPWIDLMIFIFEDKDFNKSANWDDQQLEDKLTQFISEAIAKNQGNGHPFYDWNNVSAYGTIAARQIKSRRGHSIIGQLTLEKLKDQSILGAVYTLLAARRKLRVSALKPSKRNIGNAISYVTDVFINYEKYLGSNIAVPTEFKSLYNEVSVRRLIEMAKESKDLYETEVEIAAALYADESAGDVVEIIKTCQDNWHEHFLKNNLLASASDNKNMFTFSGATQAASLQDTAENNTYKIGGYNIKNIETISHDKNPHAAKLISLLREFADYIVEDEEPDKTSAVKHFSNVFKSLGSLSPDMK